ncbi:MAG: restriction endonuclease subunit S [Planctomycetaceae bacterium]|jgi:type I restriction enzyme S subunit|nr:restriction endonuclease subunit S [Planctomycetaceae bacterium]
MTKSNWKQVKLGEVCNDVSYGYTASASKNKIGPKFLRITDIQGGIVNWDTVPFCEISNDKIEQYQLTKNDIVIARTGASTGENYLFNQEEKSVFASYLIRFRIDTDKALPLFVWYQLRSPSWWNFINGYKSGSARDGANAKVLSEYPVSLPPLPVQRQIAAVLSCLDDKIELNNRVNSNLETQAQTIFKNWFIESANNCKSGILGDILDLMYGKGLNTELRTGTGYPVVSSSGITGYHNEYYVEGPGIVIGRKGTLGNVYYLFDNFFPIDTTYYIQTKIQSTGLFYEYYLLQTLNFRSMNTDSAVPGLNRKNALSVEIKLPDIQLVEQFNKFCSIIFKQIKNNTDQSHTLSLLRDSLLPKLIGGEIKTQQGE